MYVGDDDGDVTSPDSALLGPLRRNGWRDDGLRVAGKDMRQDTRRMFETYGYSPLVGKSGKCMFSDGRCKGEHT